jgi:hypothetical protein
MGSSVRQRGFKFGDDAISGQMETQMLFGGINAATPHCECKTIERGSVDDMESSDAGSSTVSQFAAQEALAIEMVTEVRDCCEEFEGKRYEKATASQLMSLLQLQQFRCALTGVMLTPELARCDHVVPVSDGGTNQLENLQWVTEDVNKAKGVMSQDAFIAMCIQVADWARR